MDKYKYMSNFIKIGKNINNQLGAAAAAAASDDSVYGDSVSRSSSDTLISGDEDGNSVDTFDVTDNNKFSEFITTLKELSEAKNAKYFDEMIIEINGLSTNLPIPKKDFLINNIKKLQTEDEKINKYINDIIASNSNSKQILVDFKLELYKLQINTIMSLLKKFNIKSDKLDETLMNLLKSTTNKFKVLNTLLTDSDDIGIDVNEVANEQYISNLVNDLPVSQEDKTDVINLLGQFGGNSKPEPDYSIILSKFNSLFSFFKTELLVKIVFLAGYYNNLSTSVDVKYKETIKQLIENIFKLYFIEIDNIDSYEKVYNVTDTDLNKFKASYKSIYTDSGSGSDLKIYIFIPALLAQLVIKNNNTILTNNRDVLNTIYKQIVTQFMLLVKKTDDTSLYIQLLQNKDNINTLYKTIIDKNKVILTYIKNRQDTDKKVNPRYTFNPLQNNTMLNLTYKENNEPLDSSLDSSLESFKFSEESNFYFGPFDKYFDDSSNSYVAKELSTNILDNLLKGNPYCIIGYGQSGSGKTSTLIQLKINESRTDGILLELLGNKKIRNNYNIKVSGIDIRSNFKQKGNVANTGINRYIQEQLQQHEYIYDTSEQTWKNKNTNSASEYVNLPEYIINHIEKNRPIFSTPNNPQSSRSHVIIKINGVVKQDKISDEFQNFNLFVCDLAGFENTFECNNGDEIKKFFEKYETQKMKLFDITKCNSMGLNESSMIKTEFTKIKDDISSFNNSYNTNKFTTDITDDKSECKFNYISYNGTNILDYVPSNDFENEFNESRFGSNKWRDRITKMINFKDITEVDADIMLQFVILLKKSSNIVKDKIKNYDGFTDNMTDINDDYIDSIYNNSKSELENILDKHKTIEYKNNTDWNNLYNSILRWSTINSKQNIDNKIKEISKKYYETVLKEKLELSYRSDTLFTEQFQSKMYIVSNGSTYTSQKNIILKLSISTIKQIIIEKLTEIIKYIKTNRTQINALLNIDNDKQLGFTFLKIKEKLTFDTYFLDIPDDKLTNNNTLRIFLTNKETDPEKLLLEDIRLRIMKLNCMLRVEEGKMINTSLIEMKNDIKNLIIKNGSIPDTSLYWDTLYHPFCYNLNIMSNYVFEEPKKPTDPKGIIITKLQELVNMNDAVGGASATKPVTTEPLKFIIFTVINTNNDKNNPPNPPYYNINNIKFYYLNEKQKELKEEMIKIKDKAIKDPFYKNNEELKKLNLSNTINESTYTAFIEIFENNNSATLIGTLEATEELQKINMKYLCYESESKIDILKKFNTNILKDDNSFQIIGNDYKKKYLIYN